MVLKKFLLLLMVLSVLTPRGVCTGEVEKEFYLGGEKNEELRPLPNTLRTELFVGESTELFVESYPSRGATSFSWELKGDNGTVSLFPSGDKCTLLANCEGEETVMIYLRGGGSAEVSVLVKPAPEVNVRSFEPPEPDEKRDELLCRILRILVRGLILAGGGLLLYVSIFFIRRERK